MTDFNDCFVLRCTNPGAAVFVTGDPHRRIDYVVCAKHDAYLKAGGDWRLQTTSPDPREGRLELLCDPEDLNGDDSLPVEGVTGIRGSELSSRGEGTLYLVLETRRWGETESKTLNLHLTRAQRDSLRELLTR